jgi:hypothetical protein
MSLDWVSFQLVIGHHSVAVANTLQTQTTTIPTMEHPETLTIKSTIVAAPLVALDMLLERALYPLRSAQMAEAQFGSRRHFVVSGA